MNRGQFSNLLRKLGLLYPLDSLRYRIQKNQNDKANQSFKRDNPNIILPPDYLMYESFQINYTKYYFGGKESAQWIVNQIKKYTDLEGKRILDWGCGPGRIIRHLPELLNGKTEVYGTDYNEASIKWCKGNLNGIQFNLNGLSAQLPYPDNFFDAIYGISIFTHLSEEMHFNWMAELTRVLNKDGILLLTTQGENFLPKMSNEEITQFQNGELIVRGNVKEGHRTYSAFHPDAFLKQLFNRLTIMEKIVLPVEGKSYVPQDTWLLKKGE